MRTSLLRPVQGVLVAATVTTLAGSPARAQVDEPRLGTDRITQDQIESGALSLDEIRAAGLKIFSTPFNKLDGYGDGPTNPNDPTSPGGRPTLQNNGTLLRVNGLDGQTCLECHSIISNASVPAKFGIGGVGGATSNAIFQPLSIDVSDVGGNGFAAFDGRFINPPFLFGSGGVELLGKEMTADLQALKAEAQANPGTDIALVTKGVDFGTIRYQNGAFDTSGVEGVDHDLIVRPFGRKGEFTTTRAFDIEAMQFHFGMQPTEAVGENVDGDSDGVINELLTGELSALVVFNTNLERPRRSGGPGVGAGRIRFRAIGCTDCHRPALITDERVLTYSFPENPLDATENVFYQSDLSQSAAGFRKAPNGGLIVPLFADLKRHDMGPDLAETFGSELDSEFTTARLWGVADTAPYLHDGRALTLNDAIMMHGGEAQAARDAYAALNDNQKKQVIAFLKSLRTPTAPATDLVAEAQLP